MPVLAFLLAVSLSSEDLDAFFTLPSGFPTTAGKTETPGSAENYEQRQKQTVTRSLLWTARTVGISVTRGPFPVSYASGSWNIKSVAEDAFTQLVPSYWKAYPDTGDVLSPGGSDAEYIHRVVRVYYTLTQEEEEEGMTRVIALDIALARSISTSFSADGVWGPRVLRLQSDEQAALVSSFAGYCEREYYASQGQENKWDTDTYGPTHDKKKFWFVGNEYNYNTNNRSVTSARFVEGDNIENLCYYMRDVWCPEGFRHRGGRPGWIQNTDGTRMWWSSSASDVFGDEMLPNLNWSRYPTSSSLWRECARGFYCLSDDDQWTINYDGSPDTPAQVLMDHVNLGDQGYDTENCRPTQMSKSVKDAIETVFGDHADGWAITNTTTRAIPVRLGCVNQLLSLMDRTYHVPEVYDPVDVSNYYYHTSCSMEGTILTEEFTRSYPPGQFFELGWKAKLPGDELTIDWKGLSSTNYSYEGANYSRYMYHARPTTTKFDFKPSISGSRYSPSNELCDAVVAGIVRSTGFRGEFYARFSPEPGSVSGSLDGDWTYRIGCYIHAGEEYETKSVTLPYMTKPTELTVSFGYSRSTSHGHPAGTNGIYRLGTTQPGFQGASRVKAGKYGIVTGISYVTSSNSEETAYAYKTTTGDYTTRSGLLDALDDAQCDLSDKFNDLYGHDPDDWESLIRIPEGDVNNIIESLKGSNIYIIAGVNPSTTYVTGTIDDDSVQIDSVITYDNEGREITGYVHSTSLSMTWEHSHTNSANVEIKGLYLTPRIGIMTRTDWDWKTLKRE